MEVKFFSRVNIIKFISYFSNITRGFLKLSNNLSSLNKLNHDSDGVWISDFNLHSCLHFMSPFSSYFSLH